MVETPPAEVVPFGCVSVTVTVRPPPAPQEGASEGRDSITLVEETTTVKARFLSSPPPLWLR
jgi:hypothetical protein